jgi:hypothetical protein
LIHRPLHFLRQATGTLALCLALPAFASSHREAPGITRHPKLDATDFYMFRSYESGRDQYVTIVANYYPFQSPSGGPNFFQLDSNGLYEIHIDNNGDGSEDLTFQFQFSYTTKDIQLAVGGINVSVPLVNVGPLSGANPPNLNVTENYTITMVKGDRRQGTRTPISITTGGTLFTKPEDNIGAKSIPDYDAYANQYIYSINVPGYDGVMRQGKVFVGQRKDPFVVALGPAFDLVNLNPLGANNANADSLANFNVTSIVLELPIDGLKRSPTGDPVIGGWTTASLRQVEVRNPAGDYGKNDAQGGAWSQVSRLGHPLVNELVIGLKDKDRFNSSMPKNDAQFANYVTNPTLPALLNVLFGVRAPAVYPRTDLVAIFLTGVANLNTPQGTVVASEQLRLNTSIAPVAKGSQKNLGVVAGDTAGYPNGRRPGDDVVDIALRAVMGVLLTPQQAPDGQLPYTDGAFVDDSFFLNKFPYLLKPLPGAGSN